MKVLSAIGSSSAPKRVVVPMRASQPSSRSVIDAATISASRAPVSCTATNAAASGMRAKESRFGTVSTREEDTLQS